MSRKLPEAAQKKGPLHWENDGKVHRSCSESLGTGPIIGSEAPGHGMAFSWCIAKSNFTMVYGIYNELVTGAYKPTNITGGAHHWLHYFHMIICSLPSSPGLLWNTEAWFLQMGDPQVTISFKTKMVELLG